MADKGADSAAKGCQAHTSPKTEAEIPPKTEAAIPPKTEAATPPKTEAEPTVTLGNTGERAALKEELQKEWDRAHMNWETCIGRVRKANSTTSNYFHAVREVKADLQRTIEKGNLYFNELEAVSQENAKLEPPFNDIEEKFEKAVKRKADVDRLGKKISARIEKAIAAQLACAVSGEHLDKDGWGILPSGDYYIRCPATHNIKMVE